MDADEGGLFVERAEGEGEVLTAGEAFAEGVEVELPPRGGYGLGGDFFDEELGAVAVFDELLDRDERDVEAFLELDEVGDAGHGAVVFEDLADDGAGFQAGEDGEIDGGLGVAGAFEDTAGTGAEGEDVTGLDEVVGGGRGIGKEFDGVGAVGGADAGGDALCGVDGYGERGFE